MPRARSLRAVTGRRPTARRPAAFGGTARRAPGAITVRPSGFFQPEAIFARNLFGATPAERSGRVSSRIRCLEPPRHGRAERLAPAFSVTSRYASSSDSGSTSGVTARKIAKTCRETARYFAKSGPDEHRVRAQPDRARHRHRRADAERARLVARGGDDAARFGPPADRHRLARAATDRRAARPTRRRHPCRRAGSCGASRVESVRLSRRHVVAVL